MAELTSIIDTIVDAPEGFKPAKLHLLFDKKTRGYADQYETALKVARGVPFNPQQVAVTDPLVMVVANLYRITDGQQAIRQAIQYYEKWALDCTKHGWMLALLADNEFYGDPEPWDAPEAPPPGIPVIPDPKYNISNPTERRLKQIIDYLSIDMGFQQTVMTAVNDAMVMLVNEVEETDKVTGFQSKPIDTDLHGETRAVDNSDAPQSSGQSEDTLQSVDTGTVVNDTGKHSTRQGRKVKEV